MFVYAFLITFMFLLSGYYKVVGFDKTVNNFMKNTNFNLTTSKLAIIGAALLQLTCSVIIMYEAYFETGTYRKHAYYACYALAFFTVLATLIYHFPPSGMKYYAFISNVTTFGALLLLANQFKD